MFFFTRREGKEKGRTLRGAAFFLGDAGDLGLLWYSGLPNSGVAT